MSRIGKKPLPLPAGVDATIEAGKVVVKGPKGTVTVPLHAHAKVAMEADPKGLAVTVEDPTNVQDASLWGLTRQLLNNAIEGVQKPFEKQLEFVGVGFKVSMEGRKLIMDVGFSHNVEFPLPEGVDGKVEKQVVTLSSVDKYMVGEAAARIRKIRPPEPYKGKGIKYVDETIRRKAGKTAKSGA